MIAYLINAATKTIDQFEYEISAEWNQYLPGGLTLGWSFENGDELYVDDEALLRPASMAFRVKARPDGQPMMSNGILVGQEVGEQTLQPSMTVAELATKIEFLDLPDAMAWFEARKFEPAVTLTTREGTQVLTHWSEFLAALQQKL